MTNRSDIEQALDRYLAEGGEQVPDRVVDAALDQIDHTSQRHALRVPWRFPDMPYLLRSALVGAAVVAVLIVGGVLLTRGPTTNNIGGPPAASSPPSASADVSPSATPALTDTSNWIPFTSERYGYEIEHPPTWIATPGSGDWTFETSRLDYLTDDADRFIDERATYQILFTAFASDVPAEWSEDEWITAYYEGATEGCDPADEMRSIVVDGRPGRIGVDCNDSQAFVFDGARVHVFAVWRPGQEALLEAFLSTVEFQP